MELLVDERSGYFVFVDPATLHRRPRLCYLVKAVGPAATALQDMCARSAIDGVVYTQFLAQDGREGDAVAGIALVDRRYIRSAVKALVQIAKPCSGGIEVAPCTDDTDMFCTCIAPPPKVPSVMPPASAPKLSLSGASLDLVKTNQKLAMEEPSDSYAYILITAMLFGGVVVAALVMGAR